MSGFDSNDPRDEALWHLLGRARPVEPSPYFARRVARAAATDPAEGAVSWWTFFLRALAPATACAALAVVAFVGVQRDAARSAVAKSEIEFETIQNLDLLVSNYESSLWLDPSSSY